MGIVNNKKSSLYRKLTLKIVIFSTLVTIISTGFQLYNDYIVDLDNIENIQNDVLDSYTSPLQAALWVIDKTLVKSQVSGISNIRNISYVSIETPTGRKWNVGSYTKKHVVEKTKSLSHEFLADKKILLGVLTIQSDLTLVYKKLLNKAAVILLSNAIKTFIVAGFIIFLVKQMITNPLKTIAKYLKQLKLNKKGSLKLSNSYGRDAKSKDEVDAVVDSINIMNIEILDAYSKLLQSKQELDVALIDRDRLLEKEKGFKIILEQNVIERTIKLEHTLEDLKKTQNFLVEKEKMASLGSLVAGLCHEINTPLGICVTVASTLSENKQQIYDLAQKAEMTRTDFDLYMSTMEEIDLILNINLKRAVELMGHFKQVAVDQSSSNRREFDLRTMLEETAIVLSPLYKQAESLQLECPDNITMNSYPGPLGQVITNMVENAINHAYEKNSDQVKMRLVANQSNNNTVSIKFSDDGKGISEAESRKIFDPFYTTNLGTGCGLGLNISYNIVVNVLGGKISVESKIGKGTSFYIVIPRTAPNTQRSVSA